MTFLVWPANKSEKEATTVEANNCCEAAWTFHDKAKTVWVKRKGSEHGPVQHSTT